MLRTYLLSLALSLPVGASATPGTVLGWLEPVMLEGSPALLEAKIDSGADHSSLHAQNIQFSMHGNQEWVSFSSMNGQTQLRPLVRQSQIKQKNAASQPRPVVRLKVCFNRQWREIEVNLVDRSRFKQPLLIGRSALLPGELIDVHHTHLSQADCASNAD